MQYRNARYISETVIDCEINHEDLGWIPYTLNPEDTDETIDNDSLLSAMIAAGDVEPYVPPSQEELDALAAKNVRSDRDFRLNYEVDPVVSNPLLWAELTPEKQEEWRQYRLDLKNIPQQSGFPHDITWPTKPE